MNLTSAALITHTVVSVGLMRVLSGIVAGVASAVRLATVVVVVEFRLMSETSASVPVLTDQRSELHCAETLTALKRRAAAQTRNVIRILGGWFRTNSAFGHEINAVRQ